MDRAGRWFRRVLDGCVPLGWGLFGMVNLLFAGRMAQRLSVVPASPEVGLGFGVLLLVLGSIGVLCLAAGFLLFSLRLLDARIHRSTVSGDYTAARRWARAAAETGFLPRIREHYRLRDAQLQALAELRERARAASRRCPGDA